MSVIGQSSTIGNLRRIYDYEYKELQLFNSKILKELNRSYTSKLSTTQNKRTVRVQNKRASENIGAKNFKK